MNRNTILVLAGLVVVLALLLVVFESHEERADKGLLLGGLADRANAIRRVQLRFPDGDDGISVRKVDGTWVLDSRSGYAADVVALGKFVSELSEAQIVEEKTSNPQLYSRLGVDDPETGGSGTKVLLSGDGFSYELVLGNRSPGGLRFVRIPSDATSYLVDRELEAPGSADEWLRRDLLDIPADRVRKVTISHADGESLVLEKASEDDADFSVAGIPEGRELSYETVADGIAGALANLGFEAVEQADDAEATTETVFETWDGLRVTVRVSESDDSSWLQFTLDGNDAEKLGARLGGWRYRIAKHKAGLLTRRWDDILKPVP